jgi:hypothetical protein
MHEVDEKILKYLGGKTEGKESLEDVAVYV